MWVCKFYEFIRVSKTVNLVRNISLYHNVVYDQSDFSKLNLKKIIDSSVSFNEKDINDDPWSTFVYPKKSRSQELQSVRPKIDPQSTSVILFPGQGTQYVGMAKSLIEFPNVKEMFTHASAILRYDLLDLCINGPEDMLNMTAHSQVAVLVASLAAVEKLKNTDIKMVENCVATAGFSVGEYTSLVFAGSLEFSDAVRLLKIRGDAMQIASDEQPSGMMTVFLSPQSKIKLACAAAKDWCLEQAVPNADCRIASYLFPECRVISGNMEALKFIESNASQFGIRKIKYIPVSGAFHSKLMKPAENVLKNAIDATNFQLPLIPVHSNVDGHMYKNIKQIRDRLKKQLCNAVMWEQIMHILFERKKGTSFPHVFECGPGTTMKSILKLNNALAYKNCENILA